MNLRKYLIVLLSTIVVLGMVACNSRDKPPNEEDLPPQTPTTPVGDIFLSNSYNIKMTITDGSIKPARVVVVMVSVDSNDNGSGTLTVGDIERQVLSASNALYVEVAEGNYVVITDVLARGYFSDVVVVGQTDLQSQGFSLVNGEVSEYRGTKGTLSVVTQYESSSIGVAGVNVLASRVCTLQEAVLAVLDEQARLEQEEQESNPDVVDAYLNSDYGVTIDDVVYSVGDTCSPDTYFGKTPEGILTSYAYKEDQRVDFTHISYLSATGRTVFTLQGNTVRAIQTDTDFTFLDTFTKGMGSEDVKYLLGHNLTKAQKEAWTPVTEELILREYKSNTFYCYLGEFTVEFRMARNGSLNEIYIERPIGFV